MQLLPRVIKNKHFGRRTEEYVFFKRYNSGFDFFNFLQCKAERLRELEFLNKLFIKILCRQQLFYADPKQVPI